MEDVKGGERRDEETLGQEHAHHPDSPERGFEIGKDEAWFANVKRTYDEMLELSLSAARRAQTFFDATFQQYLTFQAQQNALFMQHQQNAIDTANLVNKQAAAHRDVAIHHTWDPDPHRETVLNEGSDKQ